MLELLLAVLSASAAAGMRIALPLLVIGLLSGSNAWTHVPLLNRVSPPIMLGILVSWSLVEVFASKNRLGQRVLQVVQLLLSPLVGALMGMAIAQATDVSPWLVGILGGVGGLLAFVLKLVQVGWFYRLQGLPLWLIFVQDALCVCLVVFAFDAPREGGIVALLLLWLAIRSSQAWRRWQKHDERSGKSMQRDSLPNEESRQLRDRD
ncbi:DUF4126 domain-containing protein [Phormidesmis priestleyi ULC007]|uniref:DUF4126 domain-containing protein n=1 Tax=Phormidesmis priestleyi ULC007 TaxID=1920490 RepID=A0A2T1DGG8_9CYAN|nr:DUF4126 domain-containing protein [Phormidesmis priestleyi]PSB19541.1 DUF4126 domain-containing protein [Phormidesmis priestleyi ULC007]PZO53019.1 MAG: DUF4126 domain-containing protein [Phormidesmis priestleyi]